MATLFLIVIYLAFISLGLPDSLLGSAWPVMGPDIGSSLGSAGILSMVVAGGTIVSSLASGSIVKRLGTGPATLLSCFLTAGALLGFSQAPSMIWLVLLAIPLGLGGGAVDASLNHYVAENYKAHHMAMKVRNKALIRYGQLVAIAGGILLTVPLRDSLLPVGFILIGLGLAPIYPGLLHETPARFGKENSAKLMGYQMAVAYTGTTVLPPLFGFIATHTSIALFPFVLIVFLLAMWLCSEIVNRLLQAPAVRHTNVSY